MNKRRQQQLRMDGVELKKVEGAIQTTIKNLQKEELTIQESQIVLNEVGCILKDMEKYSPETQISTFFIQDYL